MGHTHDERLLRSVMRQRRDRFVDGQQSNGSDRSTASQAPTAATAPHEIGGDASPVFELTPNVPGIVLADGLRAEIKVTEAPGGASRIVFTLVDSSGAPVTDLQPYQNAMGQLVMVRAGADQYATTQSADSPRVAANVVEFQARFLRPGLYKGWGQFQRNGKICTIPFVVRINKSNLLPTYCRIHDTVGGVGWV